MLEPLSRYGRSQQVTPAVLRDVSDKTRAWYFQTGGIYLTQRSRGPYFKWKALMQPVLDHDATSTQQVQAAVPEQQLSPILAAASELRTALSDDIGTKRLSRL